MPTSFILNNKPIELIPSALKSALVNAKTENERNCLSFMLEWLTGAEEFEQYTSGSTGPPKCIRLTRAQMTESAILTRDFFQLDSTSTLLCCLGIHYIGGKMMLVRALVLDLPLIVKDPDSRPFNNLTQKVQFTSMVPFQMMSTLVSGSEIEKELLNSCNAILLGGASISHALLDLLQPLSVAVYQSFATSESSSHIAMRRINGPQYDSYYTVLPGIQISTDTRGALVMKGSVTNHQAIVTNDMVELKNETQFRWLGRADFVINSGGIKIYPESVEAEISLLMEKYGNPLHVISSLPDEMLGERIVLCLEKAPTDPTLLLQELQDSLPRYLVPKEIMEIGIFPLLKNGKINRLAIKDLLMQQYRKQNSW